MKIVLAFALVIVIAAIAGWDIVCAAWGRPTDTVSATLQDWGQQHPMLSVAIGTVIGHIFWPTGRR